jgi:GT2 family glycosyltransferase
VDHSPKISFCIITNGKRPRELRLSVKSIEENFYIKDDYEIVVVGDNIDQFKDLNIKLVEDNVYNKYLGARKNIGTENTKADIIVHCDDDIIFPKDWFFNLEDYHSKNPDWEVLGNKILLPDGGRYYDRSIYLPRHTMVPYDFDETVDPHTLLYQCGAFSVCKRSLLDKVEWSNKIPFYGKLNGFDYNEDVDFSVKLKEAGIRISFDEKNIVWHYDHSYYYKNWFAYKKKAEEMNENKCLDFIMLLNFLER